MNWLAGNSVNCFFYDEFRGRGISSVIDFALSARRPIAISHSNMFRHIKDASPTILIEQSSLKKIIANGIDPLRPFLDRWNDVDLTAGYDNAIDYACERRDVDLVANRVLTPRDRERLRPAVAELTELCPDIMARKFPEAVFQNAFIFEQARRLAKPGNKIALIGGYEDPIGPSLARLGFDVTITDPQVDGRDSTDVLRDAFLGGTQYDLVISCSVIEHVAEDIEFVQTLYDLTVPGGVILLTTDFRDGWKAGIPKPTPDVRLYTLERLRLLANALPEGSLLSPAAWKSEAPYFHYDGATYGFCSIAFRRSDSDRSNRFITRILAKDQMRKKSDNDALRANNDALRADNNALRADNNALRVASQASVKQMQAVVLKVAEPRLNSTPIQVPIIVENTLEPRPVRRSFRKRLSMSLKKRRREWKQGIANVKFIKKFAAGPIKRSQPITEPH